MCNQLERKLIMAYEDTTKFVPKGDESIYTPVGTDVTIRWRLAGWIPPSELPEYQKKWKYYQELPLRKQDDKAKAEYELVLKKAKVARIR